MLNDYECKEAIRLGIDPNDLESFSPDTWRAVFKDGTERQLTEVTTRCMGYHRPVSEWNIGKKAEHATRKFFTEAKAIVNLVSE